MSQMDWRQALLYWRIQFRRGTTEAWADADPVLLLGEPGWDQDLKQIKIGDGVTPWSGLDFVSGIGGGGGGEAGADGQDGRGIVSVDRTDGDGSPGTTDTYTISYTDDTTSTFEVYNGADGTDGGGGIGEGTVQSVNGVEPDEDGDVTLTAADLGLGDVDNTSDADKQTANDARYLQTSAAPELIRDTMASTLVEGDNITFDVDDAGDTITINAIGGSGEGGSVDSVNGHTGVVVLTPADLGLGDAVEVYLTGTADVVGDSSTPDDLVFSIPLGVGVYAVEVEGIASAPVVSTIPRFQFQAGDGLAVDSSAPASSMAFSHATNNTAAHASGGVVDSDPLALLVSTAAINTAVGVPVMFRIMGQVTVTTAGTLSLYAGATANSITVYRGARMRAVKIDTPLEAMLYPSSTTWPGDDTFPG